VAFRFGGEARRGGPIGGVGAWEQHERGIARCERVRLCGAVVVLVEPLDRWTVGRGLRSGFDRSGFDRSGFVRPGCGGPLRGRAAPAALICDGSQPEYLQSLCLPPIHRPRPRPPPFAHAVRARAVSSRGAASSRARASGATAAASRSPWR
jgi:hypothetical protein